MAFMGVDIGTSGCKAVVFDENGNELAGKYREYALLSPKPGHAELDSEKVIDSCMSVIKGAAEKSGARVLALGISSQGEAFTPVDEDGKCLRNAMVSSDSRAADLARDWSNDFGREKLYNITGHTAHPMFTLFKLEWLRRNEPETWRRARKFLCFEDLLASRLGADAAMGWPLAGRTMMFDVKKHEWSPEILSALGLEEERLSKAQMSGSSAGAVRADIARELALPEGVMVVNGGHDQPCCSLGSGAVGEGQSMYATGTVECLCPAFRKAVMDEKLFRSNLCTYDHAMKGLYCTVAFSLTGGNILKWFRDEFGHAETEKAARIGKNPYELLLENMPDKPTSLLTLPYFTPSGTPYFDPEAKGAIIGLGMGTTRAEVMRSLLEGVAMEMRLNVEILREAGIEIKEFRTVGGGARNRKWNQLKADALGAPTLTVEANECGCLGVAMLACAAKTGEGVESLSRRWVKISGEIKPNPENAAAYSEKFKVYRELYPAIKNLSGTARPA